MNEEEKKRKAWEEYTGKANNFADWFTAIIISNFVYLIGLAGQSGAVKELIKDKLHLWTWSFYASGIGLIAIFFVKFLGVWAAKMRVDEYSKEVKDKMGSKKCEGYIEDVRFYLVIVFFVLGLITLYLNFRILKIHCDFL